MVNNNNNKIPYFFVDLNGPRSPPNTIQFVKIGLCFFFCSPSFIGCRCAAVVAYPWHSHTHNTWFQFYLLLFSSHRHGSILLFQLLTRWKTFYLSESPLFHGYWATVKFQFVKWNCRGRPLVMLISLSSRHQHNKQRPSTVPFYKLRFDRRSMLLLFFLCVLFLIICFFFCCFVAGAMESLQCRYLFRSPDGCHFHCHHK